MAKYRKVDAILEIPFIIPPSLFLGIRNLCSDSLLSSNTTLIRTKIIALINTLRALSHLGHDSPEILALVELLDRTKANETRAAQHLQQTPIDELEETRQLTSTQLSSAHIIQEIWRGFSRFLTVSARDLDSGGGSKGRTVLGPLEVMGEDVWSEWTEYYQPWYKKASKRAVVGELGRKTTRAGIVIKVSVENIYPHIIDKSMGLEDETALTILREELNSFGRQNTKEKTLDPEAQGFQYPKAS